MSPLSLLTLPADAIREFPLSEPTARWVPHPAGTRRERFLALVTVVMVASLSVVISFFG